MPLPPVRIVPLSQVDPAEVEHLLDAAFGADRHGRTAYRVRKGMPQIEALSFAATEGAALIGTLQSWPVALVTPGGVATPLVMVGPVAVRPDCQRRGVGKALMNALILAAPATGTDAMAMIGDPEYYDRFFGFSNAATGGWDLPGPFERHRLLARIARPGGLPAAGRLGPDPAWLQKPIAA